MKDHTTIIDRLRHFAPLDYRYQLEDALTSVKPHTEATVICLADALSDEDSDVRLLVIQVLRELGTKAEAALPAMIQALVDEYRLVRIATVDPVAAFGRKSKDAIPILDTWLEQSEDEFSRVVAAGHIPQIDPSQWSEMVVLLEEAVGSGSAASQHALCLLNELKVSTNEKASMDDHDERRLTVKQLITLLLEPHPDHDFFERESNVHDQRKLSESFSPTAIQHVALCELVEHRAMKAVPEILRAMEDAAMTEEVRLHAARAVFDITGNATYAVNAFDGRRSSLSAEDDST